MKADKRETLNRLSYIEGHLRGIRKMVEEDQYCVDVLKQFYAVQRALNKLEAVILRDHLASCVVEGMRNGREAEMIQELTELYDLARK
ncbi:MAG: metal-sensitive transcriptional regulator [Chloroflexi bacterium]|nr:metal-sensitive transcriptional regulator [Chloroflexota bacterium]